MQSGYISPASAAVSVHLTSLSSERKRGLHQVVQDDDDEDETGSLILKPDADECIVSIDDMMQRSALARKRPRVSSNHEPRLRLQQVNNDHAAADQCIAAGTVNPFDSLSDDVVLSILSFLSSRAQSPVDLVAITLTCKRFLKLGMNAAVLTIGSRQAMEVRASSWCPNAQSFLTRCVEAGNMQAAFTLGMIKFYCTGDKNQGMKLLAKAATAMHGDALFALAVLQLNGSGAAGERRNARAAGVALCARAAMAGSMEAARELGHCVKEGVGVARNEARGKRLLEEVNRREAMLFTKNHIAKKVVVQEQQVGGAAEIQRAAPEGSGRHATLTMYTEVVRRWVVSECGCPLPLSWLLRSRHPVHRFLAEWRLLHPPPPLLRPCHNALCGRYEIKPLEFRQCAACCSAFYCSRSCQSLDWKLRHVLLCHPTGLPCLIQI